MVAKGDEEEVDGKRVGEKQRYCFDLNYLDNRSRRGDCKEVVVDVVVMAVVVVVVDY